MLRVENIFKDISGTVAWQSPSNIAIVKYWGKHGNQLPKNPNVSFTLSNAYTQTVIHFKGKKTLDNQSTIDFLFEGKENNEFKTKIIQFIEKVESYYPFLKHLDLKIESKNSFPHSAGIASSASSMSSLALCLSDIEKSIYKNMSDSEFIVKSSTVARIGSGSACRSIFPYVSIWGKIENIDTSNDNYAISIENSIDSVFKTYKDAILIVSSDEKSVSSRAGHALMENNFFAEARYAQAKHHLTIALNALKSGNVNELGYVLEQEALTLHALMMCSNPSFILLKHSTLKIIDLIKDYRTKNNVPLYFTLDAGPNVHLLYPEKYAPKVETFIADSLLPYCEEGKVIYDKVGSGPIKLK